MPTIYREVGVDVDLEDFDTDELIQELSWRRKYPSNSDGPLADAIDYYKRGQVKEAMIYLERAFPDFYGLSNLIKE